MQPVRALQSTGKSKACFTWHYAFVKNSLVFFIKKEQYCNILLFSLASTSTLFNLIFFPLTCILIAFPKYFSWTSHCHTEIRNIFSDNRVSSNYTVLTYLHITYNYRINSNVRALSNGNLLTLLYNSLIYHRNIHIAILMITISYVHIWRKKNFFPNFQRVGNRNPTSLTNFGAPADSYCTPPTRFGYRGALLHRLPRQYCFFLLRHNAFQCKRFFLLAHENALPGFFQ